ncbi:MAG: N-formylglutamate amidohydrolase [Burkholderiaceae bacterium]
MERRRSRGVQSFTRAVLVKDAFIITCEHGGNRIPALYRPLFQSSRALLDSHRGYDAGALRMATELAGAFDAQLVTSTVSRLLVDLNRSIGHPRLFSVATRSLPAAVREEIVAQYYAPYRAQVERLVGLSVAAGRRVVHISSHSFTPELDGNVRRADVGLLYHPAHVGEAELCARWRAALMEHDPTLRVRRNYPYAGKGDGLTAHLRKRFAPGEYVGIELEINQGTVLARGRAWTALRALLIETLRSANISEVR